MKRNFVLCLAAVCAASAQAGIVYDNLSQYTFQQYPYQTGHNVMTLGGAYAGNAIKLASAGYLSSVDFAMWSGGPGPITIDVYTQVPSIGGPIVGSLIGSSTVTVPALPSAVITTFTAPLGITTPTTDIYFLIRGTSAFDPLWGGSPSIGTAGIRFVGDFGAGFQYYGPADMVMRIHNDPVPEPATLATLGLGAVLLRRRKR